MSLSLYKPEGITNNMNTTPTALNKASMRKYEDLEVPCEAILASYVWVDGTGIHLRSKDRTFDFVPKTNKDLPVWYFDGSNTAQATADNSDTFIFPEVIYHDPFRRGSHILVLADTYSYNYQPTSSNYRKNCVMLTEKAEVEEPWFGFNQEFFLTTTDGRPLGWPAGGFPAPPGPYYCAIGANKIVARDLMEAFYRCCLYAGIGLNGINPGTTPSQWNFQVGPHPGIRAADDLWMARYILARLAEEYGTVATFEPQPVPDWPGNATFCYFSSKDMREEDGILVIERAIDKLARRHGAHINEYDANNGADNVRRLNGKNGMPHIRDFTAGNLIIHRYTAQGSYLQLIYLRSIDQVSKATNLAIPELCTWPEWCLYMTLEKYWWRLRGAPRPLPPPHKPIKHDSAKTNLVS